MKPVADKDIIGDRPPWLPRTWLFLIPIALGRPDRAVVQQTTAKIGHSPFGGVGGGWCYQPYQPYTLNGVAPSATNGIVYRHVGDKYYELKDHLGNVRVVVSDRKNLNTSDNSLTAHVVSYNNYYPFGALMPGRNANSGDYRYGYQGSEKDGEIKGEGNSYTTHFRQLDPRLGKWLSRDPKATAFESPYASMRNNPIWHNDMAGDTIRVKGSKKFVRKTKFRTFLLSVFGNKEVREKIKDLKKSPHDIIISEGKKGDYTTNSTRPKTYVDYEDENFFKLPEVDYLASPEEIAKQESLYAEALANYNKNLPNGHKTPGIGDSSYLILSIDNNPKNYTEEEKEYWKTQGKNVKMNNYTTIVHEYYHAWRIAKGLVKTREAEEIKAVQFVNDNMRNKNNLREKYDNIDVPTSGNNNK